MLSGVWALLNQTELRVVERALLLGVLIDNVEVLYLGDFDVFQLRGGQDPWLEFDKLRYWRTELLLSIDNSLPVFTGLWRGIKTEFL